MLLSAASQRRDKGVTCPESMSERAFVRAVNGLVKRGLLATAGDGSGSADGAGHRDGAALTITDAGLNAIGVTPEPEPGTEPDAAPQTAKGSGRRRRALAPQPQPEPVAAQTRPATKRAQIIALLSRRAGRDAGRPDRRHRLAAPHHTGGADRLAPERPAARSIAGRGGQGGLPDRRGRRGRVIARQGGVMKPPLASERTVARGRDRAAARSWPRGPAAHAGAACGAGPPARTCPGTCCCGSWPIGCRPTRLAISTRPAVRYLDKLGRGRGIGAGPNRSPCRCPAPGRSGPARC